MSGRRGGIANQRGILNRGAVSQEWNGRWMTYQIFLSFMPFFETNCSYSKQTVLVYT